jgi:CRP/FNR family transcriptional regulator, cyclic AMP receptor protein
MNTAELLRSTAMFEGLELQDLEELAAELTSRKLQAGDLVFNQGDSGDTMYFVASGQVNIFLPTNNLRPVSLADVEVGQYFGEMALFDDKPRSAGARAVRDSIVYELGRGALTSYLERRPRAAMAILRTMNERLRQTNAMLSERVAKNVIEEFERGLSWADRLADKVAELNGSWKFIIFLMAVVGLWFVTNVPGWLMNKPLDAYPYQFFNLVLAVLVALQGPLIVMSQNRQAEKDRKEAENDFKVNLKNEVNIETIIKDLKDFRLETLGRLDSMNGPDHGTKEQH